MKPNQYWKCRCESWSRRLGWGHKSKRDDDSFSKSNGHMEIYEEVMSFLFFRIKDFDLDLLK